MIQFKSETLVSNGVVGGRPRASSVNFTVSTFRDPGSAPVRVSAAAMVQPVVRAVPTSPGSPLAVEPWRERKGVVFERVAEVGDERRSLVIGKVERHNPVI